MADEPDILQYGAGYFVGGCDSYTLPDALLDTEYVAGMNVVNRGGIIQTRPGSKSIIDIVASAENVQGFTSFTPTGGVPHLVAAVDGKIYIAAAPFNSARILTGIHFNPTSKFVIFETCLKSSDYTASGELFFLTHPYNILMIQDGTTRAAFWDGNNARHLNPSPSNNFDANNNIVTVEGFDETFIGLFMKWSGNRLWIERNGQVFASDFGNPIKFTEAQYINEGRAFYLTGDCTGMIETPEQDGLLVFTAENCTLFQTNIQNRTLWLTTQNFQKIVFPQIGCVAPFSLVKQYGLIWWFSSMGMINTDQALALNRTSRMDFQDNEMICSKGNIGPDMTGICACAFENYLLVSVPSGHRKNKHTWCLDQAVLEDGTKAWSSFWTGWFPVQWAAVKINGHERIFFISKDANNCVKIWESNQPDRTDNGAPITCWVQMKNHNFGDLKSFKRFLRAEAYGYEILGDVSFAIAVSGRKGGFYKICQKEIVATPGAVYADQIYDINTCIEGLRPQSRVINSQENVSPGNCNQCGIESVFPNDIDQAFGLLFLWSGRFGMTGFGMFAKNYGKTSSGDCETQEIGPNALSERGCSDKANTVIRCPFPIFQGTGSYTLACSRTKLDITTYGSAESIISQQDADRKAIHNARLQAEQECACAEFVWVNTIQRFTAFCPNDSITPPVTVFIKAGQFRSTVSQAYADAQALAAAKAQAEDQIFCRPQFELKINGNVIPNDGSFDFGIITGPSTATGEIHNLGPGTLLVDIITVEASVFSITDVTLPAYILEGNSLFFTIVIGTPAGPPAS
jgi:hypothetical protein